MANNAEDTTGQGNIKQEFNVASTGLNLDNSINQIAKGQLSYALNAAVENFDSNSVNYQNEPGNEFCLQFPTGYQLIGKHSITEKSKNIFFLVNPNTNSSEIGFMVNNDCVYHKLVNASCLNFNVNHPIQKVVHKITNCTTEIYWTDGYNSRRYLDIENVPYKLAPNADLCDPQYIDELDCNQLLMQPNFSIPQLGVADVVSGGSLKAGTYQFAAQYSDAVGNPYTSFYSVTNPTPIADANIVTVNYNYEVGKSIIVAVDNLDLTGQFQYFNLAVIKTINNIPSVELIGTYYIEQTSVKITYSGQNVTLIQLTINDIFEKYPYYEIAQDVTAVKDVLIWDQLTSVDRVNYQSIANQISLKWETYKIPATENYANETNATNLRGYLRDEVYAFEISFLLKNGKQTDGFHIPGRALGINENHLEVSTENADFVGNPDRIDPDTNIGYSPYWKIYNTASVIGSAVGEPIGNATPHEYGEFAYWESDQDYPCNVELWGELGGQKIRHHKFPDVLVSPIIESALFSDISGMVMQNDAVYPIGVKIDPTQINFLIQDSVLTQEQKDNIIGYKIIRGNRDVNKSIIAKGILRNVNSYTREQTEYYYPNYPYNDLNPDPFLNTKNNAWSQISEPWLITTITPGRYIFTNPDSNKSAYGDLPPVGETKEICSLTRPQTVGEGKALIGPGNYDVVLGDSCFGTKGGRVRWTDPFTTDNTISEERDTWLTNNACWNPFGNCESEYGRVGVGGNMSVECSNPWWDPCQCDIRTFVISSTLQDIGVVTPNVSRRSKLNCKAEPLPSFFSNKSKTKYRQIFNSPETAFAQPFLGNVLKLENVMFGKGKAHFVEVRNNAKYKLLTKNAQKIALDSSAAIASLGGFNAAAMFTAYQSYLTIYINGITRKNYAYSFNSIANYDYTVDIDNNLGIKQREIDLKQYLIPTVQTVGDSNNIPFNNWNRESSVFLKTIEKKLDTDYDPLPFPSDSPNMIVGASPIITDKSRITISSSNVCDVPTKEQDIEVVSYYASLKNTFPGQWGQIYSYETIDTGFQKMVNSTNTLDVVFGGDTFISRFAFKTKLPFFIDNRVGAPDDSDIFYDEIGNIAYPKYWHSARSILADYNGVAGYPMQNLISYKAHNFDCPNIENENLPYTSTFYDGYFYLFAYGVPNFYCESSYNTDLRQAFNNKEGDFWPHVTTGIPDDWVQESFVSILNDNTYTYNVTFSKQNKENTFTHLPPNWDPSSCYTHYPFRAVYSDSQEQNADNRINNWLMYKPLSLFDFPQNYGKLTSLDGVQNGAILARFENKSLLYNNLLTMNTSNPQAAYLGNPSLFSAIPIDFAETDLGFVGSQHKFLLKIPNGQITIDAKRGQIFLIQGTQIEDLSAFGSGMNRFFTDHLAFEILRYFPDITEMINGKTFVTPGVNIDNNYSGVGLHGVYDSKFDRIIITKLDYIPVDTNVKYDSNKQEFYIETLFNNFPIRTKVYLTDPDYFCNKSWTVSFNFNTKSWISFHSYLPNFYIGENNFFYSGLNACCDDFNFIALAGEMVVGTTTTTTTAIPATTTTTSTTEYIGCDIAGNVIITSCNLEGDAIITVPPTTTTTTSTICSRPFDLKVYVFFTGYQLGTGPIITSTGSKPDACEAIANTYGNPIATLFFITLNAASLAIGQTVYLNSENIDCVFVPDGWYFTQETQTTGFVYHIVSGIIVSLENCVTPTTTTTTTAFEQSCLSFTATTYSESVETVTYTDCLDNPQTLIMGSGTPPNSIEFCCTEIISYTEGITISFNGECLLS
jgi:hypothetical protein